jgi:16S rRNA processing protein RimM
MEINMYLVGKIVATHGIKGELKVKSETDFDRFKVGNELYIFKDKHYLEIKITSHRPHKGLELITINDYNDINEVLGFVGCELFTKHEEKLEDDEFYVEELVGLKVVSTNGDHLGEVIDVREVPQGYILEVKTNDKNVLIPFVNEFIIDVSDEEIIVNVIEGLI